MLPDSCNFVLMMIYRKSLQVLERRQGVNMRVNLKQPGTTFGEVSLIYTTPRSATVAATLNSVVWVLERQTFRLVV